jgi:putative tryptophan/tyrosine transport system substrate-binding protein
MAAEIGRRQFISALGSTAAAWPVVARAQQATMQVVGFVRVGSADANEGNVAAFGKGLTETGYVEGRNVTVEYRWAMGQYQRLSELAAGLVHREVNMIAVPAASDFW